MKTTTRIVTFLAGFFIASGNSLFAERLATPRDGLPVPFDADGDGFEEVAVITNPH